MSNVENVHFQIDADGTSRHLYEPRYVEPLLRTLWAESESGGASVAMHPIDPANPYVGSLRIRKDAELHAEASRLRRQFEKHPRTGGPLFDLVYSAATFEDAFQREVQRGVPQGVAPTRADIPVDLSDLTALPIIGDAIAAAIHKKFDVASPEELLRKVSIADLQTLPRIGAARAKEIYEACLKAVNAQAAVPDTTEMKGI